MMNSASVAPNASAALQDPEQPQRLFQCSTCKKCFTRVDHLTRHVRSHTRQKPYVCPVCTKGFARVDLLKRHAAGHKPDEDGTNKRQRQETVRASRVIQACETCSQNHLRCEDEKPCSRCVKKNIVCRVPASEETEESDTVHAAHDLLGLSTNFDQDPASHEGLNIDNTPNGSNAPTYNVFHQPVPNQHIIMDPAFEAPPFLGHGPSSSTQESILNDQAADMFLPDYFRNMPPFESCMSGHATPRGILDLSFNWDLDLSDLDMGFLDQYNMQVPFNAETPSTENNPGSDRRPSIESPHDGVAVRAEAYKKSVWRYIPQSNKDYGGAEQPNLALSSSNGEKSHNQARISRRAIQERMNNGTRDVLMALVLATCNPANIKRIASSFPSVELLDSLIQYFLTSPSLGAKQWFHLPTFSPSRLRPELLASVVAAGAVSTPDIPLRKLGYALQEASRIGQGKSFEEDNSLIRDLQMLQNQMLQLEIGLWSGISRKMEISESFFQPLVTMLRRGGRFRRTIWKDVIPDPHDEGQALENKWRQWVAQETYLRLVYRIFEQDRQSSMALLKQPLISYTEMGLPPLLHAEDLWYATTAQSWKAIYFSGQRKTGVDRPSLSDCLVNLDCLNYHETASIAFLHMIWGMVWEYRQMATLGARSQSQVYLNNSLVMSTRHQELTKLLDDFRVSSSVAQGSNSAVDIFLELMLVHLNAPLEELQLFAGIEGQEEARRVYPALRDWVLTPPAREAMWHAGQVLRAARGLHKGLLRNFNAIAVYHAGLIFWGYGFLKRCFSYSTNVTDRPQLVCLDSQDSIEVRRFITLDRCMPAIEGTGSGARLVRIGDTSAVMNTLVHVLRENHDALGEPCPPLVENLVQLMESLRFPTT